KLKSSVQSVARGLQHGRKGSEGTGVMIRALFRAAGAVLLAFLIVFGTSPSGSAETMASALVQAYQNNPQLNAQRASARVTDEAVPQALSGHPPRISLTGTAGEQYTATVTKSVEEKQ